LQTGNSRKPLFLDRNISKFNRGTARSPPAKLLIKSEENSDASNWKSNSISSDQQTGTAETLDDKLSTSNPQSAGPADETETSNVLTTSSSGVPPPLLLPKLPDPLWNKRPPERVGQTSSYNDCFVDDQQQVKFNYNSYKSVFLSKGYILYRSNSLKRAKEVRI
jgi:hypothetical protein